MDAWDRDVESFNDGRPAATTFPMSRFERDERYWYGEGWRKLRGNLVRFCVQESGDLLYVLCWDETGPDEVEQAVQVFVDGLLTTIERRFNTVPHADIWHHSLRLLACPDRLSGALVRQKKRLASADQNVSPEAMLGALLKSHFEEMRRQLQIEHSPHRLKVWEQIDRISRDVRGINDDPSMQRSIEHLEAVLGEIGHRYPQSRNLPRSIETLEDYFMEFCPAYQPQQWDAQLDENLPDHHSMNMADLDFLEEVTGMKPDPLECFEQLPDEHAEAFAIAHRLQNDLLPNTNPQISSARAYFLNRGISKRQFYRVVREATNLLVNCLERRI